MPPLDQHETSEFRKLILIGNSGAGKTGALASLVGAGYELRIIDLDASLRALTNHIEEIDPKLLKKVQYQTYRDRMKMGPTGPKLVGPPRAYLNAMTALEKWPDDDSDPAEWGEEKILVIDSLTNLGRAAFQWARAVNPQSSAGKKQDGRQWYGMAQDLIEDLIANVTSDAFKRFFAALRGANLVARVVYDEVHCALDHHRAEAYKAAGAELSMAGRPCIGLSATLGIQDREEIGRAHV